jgi:hypothetical protein
MVTGFLGRKVATLLGLIFTSTAAMAADRVLIVTTAAGFRHDSIETAEQVLADIAARTRWFEPVYARTDEEAVEALSASALRNVRLVIFANTTGEIAVQSRAALLDWVARGGAFIGVHSASDTWHDSPEYIEMLGGEFESHPDQTVASIFVEESTHPATKDLESPHVVFEEIYLFKNFSRDRVTMLLSLRAHPEDGEEGFFPLGWYRNHGRGRVLYTALGHREDIWTSDWFQQHLTGAIAWGLRRDSALRRRAVAR